MRYLLDVNLLIASIVQTHSKHAQAHLWLSGKGVVLCPIAELGFLRISTNPKSAIGLSMHHAREILTKFVSERQADRIPDDLLPLESRPQKSDQVTDHYLADLAAKHGLRFATFDEGMSHPSVELVR